MSRIPTPANESELVNLREYNAKVFDCGNGVRRVISSRTPIHYREDDGTLHDIDIIPVVSGTTACVRKAPYLFDIHQSGIGFQYQSRKFGNISVQLDSINGQPIENINYSFEQERNRIKFNNVAVDTDIVFEIKSQGVKTYRVLRSDAAAKNFTWSVQHEAQNANLVQNNLIGVDRRNKKLQLVNNVTSSGHVMTVEETWTGKVRDRDRTTRIPFWSNNVTYPVIIDPTITEEVAATADDVTETNNTTISTSTLKLGFGSSSTIYNLGVRFITVPIDQGASIQSGILRLNVIGDLGGTYGNYGSGLIYGYDNDNAAQWTGAIRPSNVTKTTATTILPRATTTGIQSYNVTTIVQEIVDRAGFANNNSIAFAIINQEIATDRGTRFEDFEAAGTDEPLLEITYTAGANSGTVDGNIPLYIAGHLVSSGTLDLYTGGYATSSGNIPLYIEGYATNSGNIPLFISGSILDSGNITLYTTAHGISSGDITLFIHGFSSDSGNIPLYTQGAFFSSGSLDLYIPSLAKSSGNMNLYVGGTDNHLNSSGNLTLFTWSATNSGSFNTLDLYLYNIQQFNPANTMNLFIEGPGYETSTSSMNLVLFYDSTSSGNAIPLFIGNYYGEGISGIPLYMSAPEGTLGAIPNSGSMNLYIERQYEGNYSSIPLYLHMGEPSSGVLALYIAGETTSNNTLPLYMSGVHYPFETLKLFTHGYG